MLWAVGPMIHHSHYKTKIHSKDDSEEGHENTPVHQVLGTMHLGLFPQAKRLPSLAKSPLQAALQVACSQGGFTLYLENRP
jgi:hypothetical protein